MSQRETHLVWGIDFRFDVSGLRMLGLFAIRPERVLYLLVGLLSE